MCDICEKTEQSKAICCKMQNAGLRYIANSLSGKYCVPNDRILLLLRECEDILTTYACGPSQCLLKRIKNVSSLGESKELWVRGCILSKELKAFLGDS